MVDDGRAPVVVVADCVAAVASDAVVEARAAAGSVVLVGPRSAVVFEVSGTVVDDVATTALAAVVPSGGAFGATEEDGARPCSAGPEHAAAATTSAASSHACNLAPRLRW